MNSNFVNANDNNLYRMGVNPNLMGMNTQFSNMNTNVNNNTKPAHVINNTTV